MEEEQLQEYGVGGGGGGGNNNMGDLRHFISTIPMTPVAQYPPQPQHGGAFTPLHYPHQQYEMMLVMDGGRSHVRQVDFHSDSTNTVGTATTSAPAGVGLDGGGSTSRWPRQETLILLEVRSRLHHKFKEANHKGPLWDEVSRIMFEEHGYQRSGKKCREKFENLYKYYKKTKGGKAGRQDGKHYRFFRQLEALYGEPEQSHTHLNMSAGNATPSNIHYQYHSEMNATTTINSQRGHYEEECLRSISLCDSSSSDLNTSSSGDTNNLSRAKRRGKRSWKSKIKGFIELQMRKIIDKQDAWLEKTMRMLEQREKERISREEEWWKNETERMERDHKLWADERSWIEARDRTLMVALEKLKANDLTCSNHSDELLIMGAHQRQLHQSKVVEESRTNRDNDDDDDDDRWAESEILELIQLKASIDARFSGGSELEADLWEQIATRMASSGYHRRSSKMCKEKWDLVNDVIEKRKENWRINSSKTSHPLCSYGEINSPRSIGMVTPGGGGGNPINDTFKFLLDNQADTHLLGSYGVNLNKGN